MLKHNGGDEMNSTRFSSPTKEAKYHIRNFLAENKDTPQSCSDIIQFVRSQNETLRVPVISGALRTMWSNGELIKPCRGMYKLNDNPPCFVPAPASVSSILEEALSCINSFNIKVSDIDDPDTFLHNQQILVETQKFLSEQIAKLK